MKPLSQEALKSALHYDPETGVFTYAKKTRFRNAGDVAGYVGRNGYRTILVNDQTYYAHRLAFLYMTGAFPAAIVDHINFDRADNRWCNLRNATYAENNANKRIRKDNKSGFVGVHWSKTAKKWSAVVTVNKKPMALGFFDSAEEAGVIAAAAREQYFGEFANQHPRKQ